MYINKYNVLIFESFLISWRKAESIAIYINHQIQLHVWCSKPYFICL